VLPQRVAENALRHPLRVYAALELGIAVAALCIPSALHFARQLQGTLLGGLDLLPEVESQASAFFYVAVSCVVLVIPTGCMGATFPLLVRQAVRHDRQIGARVSLLHAANTLGAAVGTLVTAFVLLPTFGLTHTVFVAVALNGLVFVCAGTLASKERTIGVETFTPNASEGRAHNTWILPVILLSGMVSFTYEVLWTRLLTHLLGSSVYAFSTMLATFLMGLALGAALVAPLAANTRRARYGFALVQVGCAVSTLCAYRLIDRLPG